VHFTKLRLNGFKSFVDSTELSIAEGLTGVVGPNGCGKSNLVEALRWAMGETSAKRIRGGEMDDVIFAGTGARPGRNIAEVTLLLDNSNRRAPAPYAETEDIEVSRRIERGMGSAYHINGHEVRARDVQLLFADAASGAHSAAMVSQGRVSAVIAAKPVERRALLEEAAGISGLHARRHEAELRLKAAEANLTRLDDVIATLAAQLEGLRKQARQAKRYRRLSEQIRRLEAIALYLRWRTASTELDGANTALSAAEIAVADRMAEALAAERAGEAAADALPPLRQAEVAAAAELQRLTRALHALDDEERRVVAARTTAEERLAQFAADLAREDELALDARAAIERLTAEHEPLTAARAGEAEAQQAALAALSAASEAVNAAEAELTGRTRLLAEEEAQRAAYQRQIAEAGERRARLLERRAELTRHRDMLEAEIAAAPKRDDDALAEAGARLEASRAAAEAAAETLRQTEAEAAGARAPAQEAESRRAKLRGEMLALTELLVALGERRWTPILDSIFVEPGYEAALGAALGDDLIAPVDGEAPLHWHALPSYADDLTLPGEAEPLVRFVKAPPVLGRRLAQIGIVADAATAERLQPSLRPGQRLATRDGGLWRWDGLRRAPGTPSAAAQRLRQRNRLAELGEELRAAEQELVALTARFDAAQAALKTAAESERAGRDAMREALAALADAQARDAGHRQAEAAFAARRAAIEDGLARIAGEIDDALSHEAAAQVASGALPDPGLHRDAIATLRLALAAQRGDEASRRSEHDRLQNEAAQRTARLAALVTERLSWDGRAQAASRQRQRIDERRVALQAEIAALDRRPDEITAEREHLADSVSGSTRRRDQAGDALAIGETSLKETEANRRAAETALGAAREERVRVESLRERAQEHRGEVEARIAERFDCPPAEILDAANAELEPGAEREEPSAPDEVEARLERLLRERDNMGPVNLVAESEAEEIEARYEGLANERADLTAAIARLRQGIAALNREGRERMLAAFTQINEHFGKLFERLFGGGRAYLALEQPQPEEGEAAASGDAAETVDPLEAGLEIMARPPGKKLQNISLLSGGEQALTALALIFAAFLTNPAPICVLDEVDAPMDDANVDRFCRMVAEISDTTETRFLIVTHHRLTMARMDRLYGVTMAEQGVSQLVSVDLQQAEELRKTA
jgi:chromosome segregation protein